MDDVELDELCDSLYRRKPAWSIGSLSAVGAKFLAHALSATPDAARVVEIGTASGFSTALMASVLRRRQQAGGEDDWQVHSFDVTDRFYGDRSRKAGDAARELVPELLDRVAFHPFTTAVDVGRLLAPATVDFLFIDGAHKHPWPSIDLLLCLPSLRPGATVVLDDVNLPLIRPEFPDWGAHHLYKSLPVDKEDGAFVGPDRVPSMGRFRVPGDPSDLRRHLVDLVHRYEWQAEIPAEVLDRVGDGLRRPDR